MQFVQESSWSGRDRARPSRVLRRTLVIIGLVLTVQFAHANDSAVEFSVGGLRLRQERSVAMARERLVISRDLVRVEYEFRNTTTTPVSSEVAFPIPPFRYEFADPAGPRDFSDFKAWVDDKPVRVAKEVRAFVGGRDITDALRRAHITIERFGYYDPAGDEPGGPYEVKSLSPALRSVLVRLGALRKEDPHDPDEPWAYAPRWEARVTYHWSQVFPPGRVVHVRHEYRPVVGFSPVQIDPFLRKHRDACLSRPDMELARRRVAASLQSDPYRDGYFGAAWVSYILTTANTWQTPIRDFELIVKGAGDQIASFCWDGPVERMDPTTLRVRKANFIPTKELKIYFLEF
jgi:hypothetical protein